ncbi:MAG: response regulator transcription factor [Alphaproteobacteria bacterium]|nr:response regulator transcription factor [Alphaproteobacteria bacterium]MDA7989451.1 response regulator transcription factor [Alphaproteobacteria bacterium]MDA8001394.1 response regulator transcription factor [Alphaproteobacteria bacterium]MDA8004372.1 response regulator transcription factor [Alphaproteobacteria bacterium]MDA8006291.1 response regulator transcription factor [Alphaproteobacteria bacterium]
MQILLIEDDPETRDYLLRGLGEQGHRVEWAETAADAEALAFDTPWDAIVLDRMLRADADGLKLLSQWRGRGLRAPVLILSALGSVDERVRGLDVGADDYLTKPFAFSELMARLEALHRRPPAENHANETRLHLGDLTLDLLARTAHRDGKRIELQRREFQLLEYLLRNAGRTVTRTMLLERVWGYHFDPQSGVIDVHISRLRRKLDKDFPVPLLHTVRHVGYRLAYEPDDSNGGG